MSRPAKDVCGSLKKPPSIMKVHKVRTKTLWLFLAAFSASVSAADIREGEAECHLRSIDELGMDSEGCGAGLAGGLEGRS
jgi:hypothetical protein